jgi:hypothetical protein
MHNKLISLGMVSVVALGVNAATHRVISGVVTDARDGEKLEFVTVTLPDNELWTMTDENGRYHIEIADGEVTTLTFQCMGYRSATVNIADAKDNVLNITMLRDNLTLNEVTVTAERTTDEMAMSYNMDRKTLEHAQILSVSDVNGLLPGGKTRADNTLLTDSRIALRSGSSELGNASFGTAVEVDGVRMSNNASVEETAGVDTRTVSTEDVAGVEVITGMPSVEHGDLSNGIVKIKTTRGRTPFTVTLSTKPHTKQVAVSKGLSLGSPAAGLLNLSGEFARSVSDLASPHTAYRRLGFNARYSNSFSVLGRQMSFNAGVATNFGGSNSESDPDAYDLAYVKQRDNEIRANVGMKWLINSAVITNLNISASVDYRDKQRRENTNKSSSSTQPLIHSTETGYFIATDYDVDPNASIILGPTGYWYQLSYLDDKPLNINAKIKADKVINTTSTKNVVNVGAEYSRSSNNGSGLYYDDMRYAPTWREYRYDELPAMNNISVFGEDEFTLNHLGAGSLKARAGVRADVVSIKGSEYSTKVGISPRLSLKYNIFERGENALSVIGGWGKAVKLPSFEVLYPRTTYGDKLAFAPGSLADGTSFYAYYTIAQKPVFNSDLKLQSVNQTEVGIEGQTSFMKYSLTYYHNRTINPYISTVVYNPYTYNRTTQKDLENCPIPSANRHYDINRETGVVTVTDITGQNQPYTVGYSAQNTFKSNTIYTNGSPVTRQGLEWVLDFKRIEPLRTSIRLDGNFYNYRGVEQTMTAYCPISTQMANGEPYKYVGYYVGKSQVANGTLSRQLNTNVTLTTHIPKIRMIVSLKFEATFYNYARSLSEWDEGVRSIILNSSSDYTGTSGNLSDGNKYIATYPVYYTTLDNPDEKIPFAEKFLWAKENDPVLYNELTRLVMKSNTDYYFKPQRITSYFSANLSVTKEFGDRASLMFYATNFFNHIGLIRNTATDRVTSLYDSSYIPNFYYGLTLRIKI